MSVRCAIVVGGAIVASAIALAGCGRELSRPRGFDAERTAAMERAAATLEGRHRKVSITVCPKDPEQCAAEHEAITAELDQVARDFDDQPGAGALRDRAARAYGSLGSMVRFRLSDPRRAVPLYTRMSQSPGLAAEADFLLGDLHQHELADQRAAIRYYERALDEANDPQRPRDDLSKAIDRSVAALVEHEIDFLKTGRPFRGRLTRADIDAAEYWRMAGRWPVVRPAGMPRQPPPSGVSHTLLVNEMYRLDEFGSAEDVLAFVTRQDPGRYLAAIVLGTWANVAAIKWDPRLPVDRLTNAANVQEAARRFEMDTGIQLHLEN